MSTVRAWSQFVLIRLRAARDLSLGRDESGFIVSAEMIIIVTLMVIGLIAGMSCLQTALTAEYRDVAWALSGLDQSYAYPGFRGCKGSFTRGSGYWDGFNLPGWGWNQGWGGDLGYGVIGGMGGGGSLGYTGYDVETPSVPQAPQPAPCPTGDCPPLPCPNGDCPPGPCPTGDCPPAGGRGGPITPIPEEGTRTPMAPRHPAGTKPSSPTRSYESEPAPASRGGVQ